MSLEIKITIEERNDGKLDIHVISESGEEGSSTKEVVAGEFIAKHLVDVVREFSKWKGAIARERELEDANNKYNQTHPDLRGTSMS